LSKYFSVVLKLTVTYRLPVYFNIITLYKEGIKTWRIRTSDPRVWIL